MSKKLHDEASATKRIENYNKSWYQHGSRVLDQLNLKNFKMLDLGCGNGEFSEIARDRYQADVVSLDYSEVHLEKVKKKGFKTVKCDFDNLEDVEKVNQMYSSTFDVIVSFEVVEHIFDVDIFLTTAHNLLKKNGVLIISTPNYGYIAFRIYSMFRDNIPVSEGHHIRFFSQRRLKQTLLLNGFTNIKDFSFGKSNYYLDRAIGHSRKKSRVFIIKTLFKLWHRLSRKSSSFTRSNLLFQATKDSTPPIGLNPHYREESYSSLSTDQKKSVINKLSPYRRKNFFDEHFGLIKFIDEEQSLIDGK